MTLQTSQQFVYCPYTGVKISGVAARNCNYCNLETYICSHSGKPCVAKKGLEQFAQSLVKGSEDSLSDYKQLFPSATIDPNSPLLSTSYGL